jgi:hypothetical protein
MKIREIQFAGEPGAAQNVVDDLDQLVVLPIEQVSWYVGFEFHCHRVGFSKAADSKNILT